MVSTSPGHAGDESKEPVPSIELGALKGPDGRPVDLSPPKDGISVLLFYSTECPISNAYSPTLNTLFDAFHSPAVKWTGICVDPDLSDADVKTHARDFGLKFPVVRDRNGALARKVGATMTPEAFVVDAQGQIRYHGRIDDQFAARRVRNANPTGSELKDALAAVLDGEEVKVPHVAAVGCPIPEARAASTAPTYSKDVAPILQKNCQECHRKGQVGPFALETYEQARKRAEDIAAVVEDRTMPPWKASRQVGLEVQARSVALRAGDRHDRRPGPRPALPRATPPTCPRRRGSRTTGRSGGPDLVLDIGTDFAVPATGDDIYRCFVVPTEPAEGHVRLGDRVSAGQPPGRPSHPGVRRDHGQGPQAGRRPTRARATRASPAPACEIHGDLGGWAPGNQPSQLPDGIGRSLPARAPT